ncbi:UNVERIFIED_CONTAM: hypothetical protein FKN15_036627 [Acipenser sinensis]
MLRLRCKAKNGTHLMQGLTSLSCVQELKDKVAELTGIPCEVQKIMAGYPPSSLDLSNGDVHLQDFPIKSGDTLIVEEEKNKPKPQPPLGVSKSNASPSLPKDSSPVLARRVVPADNSCLFTSVIGWFQRPQQTVRVDRFGEDAGFSKRVLLIYNGIHYDPLQRAVPGSDAPAQTIFSTSDDIILAQALELADEARRKRQFTDVNRFSLHCMVCQKGLVGQAEARDHAKETGHTNFGEV